MKDELTTDMHYSFLEDELSKERYDELFEVASQNEPPKELVDFAKNNCVLPISGLKYVGKYYNGRNAYRPIYDVEGCPKLGRPKYFSTNKHFKPILISGDEGMNFFMHLKRLNKENSESSGTGLK